MNIRAGNTASDRRTRPPALVVVVDDDESVRESLPDLLKELGFQSQAFASARDFLESDQTSEIRCLILDITMPGMTGPELRRELIRRGRAIPTIFITARAEGSICGQLIAQGAVDCLLKPFSDQDLQKALHAAMAVGQASESP